MFLKNKISFLEFIKQLRTKFPNKIIIAGNGSILKNNYFRSELNNALTFDFEEIKWIFLDISPAYTSGILSARLKGFEINKKSLLYSSNSISNSNFMK